MRVDAIVGQAKKQESPKATETKVSGTIHHVHILDSSGSMYGTKYENAVKGIKLDVKTIKDSRADYPDLTETMSIIEFASGVSSLGAEITKNHYILKPVEEISEFYLKCLNGGTPLYQAVGQIIEKLLTLKKKEDKVVLKIFTDGEELHSTGMYKHPDTLRQLIEKVEKEDNFTITFVGTDKDVRSVVTKLSIDVSNTLVHDNTSRGVEMSFLVGADATTQYRKSVSKGEDVSKNYYTKTVEK